ncbi:MAG: DUF6438 domain-containing protein [Acidobacteriota bacterium]|nr:DUF6438 domain-containing protein [Acidobacteriota bacterium]
MMRKNSPAFVLVFLFLTFLVQESSSQTRPKIDGIPSDLRISMERTICFGGCTPYKVTIDNQGKVVFEGYDKTKTQERAESVITQEQLGELITEFEKADFFALKDKYKDAKDGCTWLVTCHPSAIISIQINGETKTVEHYLGCTAGKPTESLGELGAKIDRIAETRRWSFIEGK